MKKLFFTAIALVAFSGISLASNGEVYVLAKVQEGDPILDKLPVTINCDQERDAAVQDVLSNGGTKWQAYYEGAAAWGECMRTKGIGGI